MKLQLKSDFRETYDAWFDTEGPVFRRMTADGPNRIEMFQLLASLGYAVPLHGYVQDVLGYYWNNNVVDHLVVYHDIEAHRGEGKNLFKPRDCELAMKYKPDDFANRFCSAFIKQEGDPTSLRLLKIGTEVFYIEYKSNDLWRSNCGDVETRILVR